MVRGAATPTKVREIIIKMFCGGKKMRQIARDLDISKSTVVDIIKSYGENGNTDIKGKSPGRPRLVTDRQRRELVKICKKNRRGTLRDVTSEWNEAGKSSYCRETCRKWIHKSGFGFYKAKEKPLLTERQKKKRLSWCKERVGWTQEQWNSVIFSDESKFDVCVGDNRKRVIRNKNEAFHKDCLKRTVKFASGVMIWGCMSAKGVGNMQFINGTVNAVKYQEILESNLLPSIQTLCPAEIYFSTRWRVMPYS